MDVSVIVPTRDRHQQLQLFLESISKWKVPSSIDWEVLIVDNNPSTPETQIVVAWHAKRNPRIKYLRENRPGKSAAVNAALRVARGEFLAFTDDDCIAHPDWLCEIVNVMRAEPLLGAIGGRVELYDPTHKPVTLRLSKESVRFEPTQNLFNCIAGCNMALRREVVEKIGGLDITLGPGTPLKAAEDIDYLYRAHKSGARAMYSPRPLVLHNHGRTTDEQVTALHAAYLKGRGAFYWKHRLDRVIQKVIYWEVRVLIRERDWRTLAKLLGGFCAAVRGMRVRTESAIPAPSIL